ERRQRQRRDDRHGDGHDQWRGHRGPDDAECRPHRREQRHRLVYHGEAVMSRLTDAIAAERRRLAQREADAVRRLLIAHDAILAALDDDLRAVTEMIEAAIAAGEPVTIDWLRRQERYHRLMDDVQASYRQYALIVQDEAASAQWAGARQGAEDAIERVTAMGLTTQVMTARVNVPALERLMGALSPGSPLRQVIDRYGDTAASIIEQELIAGTGRGAGPREVARLIRKRVDGVMASRSLALTRTELLRAYRGSLFDQYAAMGFQQWQWSAAMSTRTCLACISRSGKVYSMDNPFMLAHVNCRCSPVPVHPAATARIPSGEEWFARQSADVQRRM